MGNVFENQRNFLYTTLSFTQNNERWTNDLDHLEKLSFFHNERKNKNKLEKRLLFFTAQTNFAKTIVFFTKQIFSNKLLQKRSFFTEKTTILIQKENEQNRWMRIF